MQHKNYTSELSSTLVFNSSCTFNQDVIYINKYAKSRGNKFNLYTKLTSETRNFLDNPRRTMMYSKMLILQAKYKPSADRWNSDTNVGEWQQPLAAENWRWRIQFPTHTVANDSLTFILMQKFLLPPVIFYKQVQTNTP